MFRGPTARALFALLAVALFALQLLTPTGTFAPAHTAGQPLAMTEPGNASPALPVRDGADTFRGPDRPGGPVGLPHVRDRQRGSASGRAQEHPLIPGRAAGADPSDTSGAPRHALPGTSRAHTPAALQVFRC